MWRSSPFLIPISFAVAVRNLSTANPGTRSSAFARRGLRERTMRAFRLLIWTQARSANALLSLKQTRALQCRACGPFCLPNI
jgi:hypothetical protein